MAAGRFEIVEDHTYSVSVLSAELAVASNALDLFQARPLPEGTTSALILRSRDGTAVVEIVAWPDGIVSEKTATPYVPAARLYWRRDFDLVTSFAKQDQGFAVTLGDAVQWSEFLLRDPDDIDELSGMVGGMTEAMTVGGPETLLSIQQLRSEHDTSIGLFGRWAKPEGFEVFLEEGTFGDKPYWDDYADNAHWMMEVISIR